jgi:hypothetical protein
MRARRPRPWLHSSCPRRGVAEREQLEEMGPIHYVLLDALKDEEILTQEEFASQKAKMLAS